MQHRTTSIRIVVTLALLSLLTLRVSTVLAATTWTQRAHLTAHDAVIDDFFGKAVALNADRDIAVVGAPGKGSKGAVYVFVRSGSTWVESAELTAGDADTTDFGWSVALDEDGRTALVGAPTFSRSGAAYVFARSGTSWTQRAKLVAGDAATGDEFGFAVALDEDARTAFIGAPAPSAKAGATYVFTPSGTAWSQQAELTAFDSAPFDDFGFSVALDEDGRTALIGATKTHQETGAAYVFTRSATTWTQRAELAAGDAVFGDNFGFSVALDGEGRTALIGAIAHQSTGTAYVFTRAGPTWTQRSELSPRDAGVSGEFGFAVALDEDGNTALIGAPLTDRSTGAAYVFAQTGNAWIQRKELTALSAVVGDGFGVSVSLDEDGETGLVGAWFKHRYNGAAFVFSR